jgi:hypothetical protein
MLNVHEKLIKKLAESKGDKEKYHLYLKEVVEKNARILGDKIVTDAYFKELACMYPQDVNSILLKERIRSIRDELIYLKEINERVLKRRIEKLENECKRLKNIDINAYKPEELINKLIIPEAEKANKTFYLAKGLKNASIHYKTYKKVIERLEKAKRRHMWW